MSQCLPTPTNKNTPLHQKSTPTTELADEGHTNELWANDNSNDNNADDVTPPPATELATSTITVAPETDIDVYTDEATGTYTDQYDIPLRHDPDAGNLHDDTVHLIATIPSHNATRGGKQKPNRTSTNNRY